MDVTAITIFGLAGFVGAVLSGYIGYLAREKKEGVDKGKIIQDLVAGTMVCLSAVVASMSNLSPTGDWMGAILLGLMTGYGVNSLRVDAGLKK